MLMSCDTVGNLFYAKLFPIHKYEIGKASHQGSLSDVVRLGQSSGHRQGSLKNARGNPNNVDCLLVSRTFHQKKIMEAFPYMQCNGILMVFGALRVSGG